VLEVEPLVSMATWSPEVAKTASKPSPAPLQKHSLDGCTINMAQSNFHQRRHIVSPCDTLLSCSHM